MKVYKKTYHILASKRVEFNNILIIIQNEKNSIAIMIFEQFIRNYFIIKTSFIEHNMNK